MPVAAAAQNVPLSGPYMLMCYQEIAHSISHSLFIIFVPV